VQEFETISYPTLQSFKKPINLSKLLNTCILLTPCYGQVF